MAGEIEKNQWRTFKVAMPKNLTSSQRREIAQRIIDEMIVKIQSGINPGTGKSWGNSYSKEYGKSGPVDLTLSTEMLSSIDVVSESEESVTIGIPSGAPAKLRGKAEGNHKGT